LGGNSEAIAEGTPLFGLRGELIGITNSGENKANPTSFWQKNFFTLIKNEEIKRPYLGVHYLDLSSSPGMEKNFSQNKTAGALIWSDKALGIAGVIKNSPAEKAGLRDGDIILKINSEELTAKTNLADIVADYAPGIKIRLTISRNEEEKTVEAELTNSPISATLNR
jgi:S1-C subfamily serine protease